MQKLTVTVKEACEALSIGRSKLYEMLGEQRLDSICLGRRRLITTESIRALVDAARTSASSDAS